MLAMSEMVLESRDYDFWTYLSKILFDDSKHIWQVYMVIMVMVIMVIMIIMVI